MNHAIRVAGIPKAPKPSKICQSSVRALNRPDEALASYNEALALKPDYVEAYENKGNILTEFGRFDEAVIVLQRAIKLAPRRTRAYYALTRIKALAQDDPYLLAMEELARDLPSLTPDEQIELNFALGKAFADIGDEERSFRHLLDGNKWKRKQTDYDEETTLRFLDRMRTVFTDELIRGKKGGGERSSIPVFIVGMPRSGTTLVEQILASHPKVFGAGEINTFVHAIMGLGGRPSEAWRSPEVVSTMTAEQLHELGASYVARVRNLAPGAERITNKMLDNFRFVGLIQLALPNARVVHMRRDPIDTCLSCFSKLFAGDLSYTSDLGELGRYYRAYQTMMTHWRRVLPQNVMLEVEYEEVVADLEGQARRIVAHCGLEWDSRCLDFHQTKRQVRTASVTQVRQPIYKSSVGRWRAYESFLKPLLTELERI